MSKLLGKERLDLELLVDSHYLNGLRTNKHFSEVTLLDKICGSHELKEQIPLVKQLCSIAINNEDPIRENLLNLLVNIYLRIHPKNTLKKVLASTFQNFPNQYRQEVKQIIKSQVTSIAESCDRSEYDGTLHYRTETVAALMDNFPLGEEVLKDIPVSVLEMLSSILSKEFHSMHPGLSAVQLNDHMYHCLVCIQATNRMLQKCSRELRIMLDSDKDDMIRVRALSKSYMATVMAILKTDNFLLDCRTSGSMLIVLLLKTVNKSTALSNVTSLVLSMDRSLPNSVNPPQEIQDLHCLSPLSMLCLCHGALAQLDPSELLSTIASSGVVLFEFLTTIFTISKRNQDMSGKLLCSRSVLLWTSKARTCLKSAELTNEQRHQFSGYSTVLNKVLQYVWTIWEDNVDAIRFTAKDIFENVIKIHQMCVCTADDDKFLKDTAQSLLFNVSWSCKGKFGTLGSVAMAMGTSELLTMEPNLPAIVLNHTKEQTLSHHGSDLYYKLFTSHKQQLLDKGEDQTLWMKTWVDPVLESLSGIDVQLKTHIIEQILPKLLKAGKDVLDYMIKQLSVFKSCDQSKQLGALIMCLRRARVLGLMQKQEPSSDSPECLFGVVSVTVVHQALSSADDQVRLDAFALLCDNHKTSEPISLLEFKLIQHFLLWNLNNQSPSFRQHLLSHVKKLFQRFKESEIAVLRKMKAKDKQLESSTGTVQYYQDFQTWLFNLLLHCLYPGASFARRSTSLSILSLMVDTFSHDHDTGFTLKTYWEGKHIQTLMECLTDTFEDNKMEAFKILKSCFNMGLDLQSQTGMCLESLLRVCMDLAGSTKPQDCTTAAYLFRSLLLQPNIHTFLSNSDHLMSDYIQDTTRSTTNFVQEIYEKSPNAGVEKFENCTDQSKGSLQLLWILLFYLRDQLSVASSRLAVAAITRPMYPTLHCIRYILFDVNLKKLSPPEMNLWEVFIVEVLDTCLEISRLVSPVVHNSSPEGNLPQEVIEGLNLSLKEEASDKPQNSSTTTSTSVGIDRVMLMPEYLTVCCWRNVKEVSLLLGQLTQDAPIIDPQRKSLSTGLLNVEQVKTIGDYFTRQLLDSIHRGAFELACAGFVKQCDMLWKSNIKELNQLPGQWLESVMMEVKGDDTNNRLCATRRSAGLPFFIQTLVSTEPGSTGRPCFKSTMDVLLELAQITDKETISNAKVHALNILRALYRDTRLGEVVTPYISSGLQAAVLGFQSPFWAVRNSATLLLSAMITRIFGVKRSKDESNLSKKNCLSGRQFFYQYPDLFPFLLKQLEAATKEIGDSRTLHLHPGLYPVLMILSRLFQSPLENTDTSLNLSAFIPHITRCSYSPVFKTRQMASRALRPLVQRDKMKTVLQQLLSLIPDDIDKEVIHVCTSRVHGALLQVNGLLEMIKDQAGEEWYDTCIVVVESWSKKLWYLESCNRCYYTRMEAYTFSLRLIEILSCKPPQQNCVVYNSLFSKFKDTLISACSSGEFSNTKLQNLPGYIEFATTISDIFLTRIVFSCDIHVYKTEEKVGIVCNLLDSEVYDVRLAVLDNLTQRILIEDVPQEDIFEVLTSREILEKLLHMALGKEDHFECHIKVLELLNKHPSLQGCSWSQVYPSFPATQIFEQFLGVISHTRRDEIKCQAIEFMRLLMSDVIKGTKSQEPSNLLKRWMDVLLCSIGSEQSVELQCSVAEVIQYNADLLKSHDYLGPLTFTFWDILVQLQQSDDQKVKDIVTKVILELQPDITVPLHPTLALDRTVKVMIELHGKSRGKHCLETLLNWIMRADITDKEGEERLFDKSEMNTFKEDLVFTEIVVKHILNSMTMLKQHSESFIPLDMVRENEMALTEMRESQTQINIEENELNELREKFNEKLSQQCYNWENISELTPFVKSGLYQEQAGLVYKYFVTDLLINSFFKDANRVKHANTKLQLFKDMVPNTFFLAHSCWLKIGMF